MDTRKNDVEETSISKAIFPSGAEKGGHVSCTLILHDSGTTYVWENHPS